MESLVYHTYVTDTLTSWRQIMLLQHWLDNCQTLLSHVIITCTILPGGLLALPQSRSLRKGEDTPDVKHRKTDSANKLTSRAPGLQSVQIAPGLYQTCLNDWRIGGLGKEASVAAAVVLGRGDPGIPAVFPLCSRLSCPGRLCKTPPGLLGAPRPLRSP